MYVYDLAQRTAHNEGVPREFSETLYLMVLILHLWIYYLIVSFLFYNALKHTTILKWIPLPNLPMCYTIAFLTLTDVVMYVKIMAPLIYLV